MFFFGGRAARDFNAFCCERYWNHHAQDSVREFPAIECFLCRFVQNGMAGAAYRCHAVNQSIIDIYANLEQTGSSPMPGLGFDRIFRQWRMRHRNRVGLPSVGSRKQCNHRRNRGEACYQCFHVSRMTDGQRHLVIKNIEPYKPLSSPAHVCSARTECDPCLP